MLAELYFGFRVGCTLYIEFLAIGGICPVHSSANYLLPSQGDPTTFCGKKEAINPNAFKTLVLISRDKIALLQITTVF